jgi:hypothetical protein
MVQLLKEFCRFALSQKKFWLIPIIVALLMVSALIFLSETSSLSYFIYPLF